jgi:hypothetical protein
VRRVGLIRGLRKVGRILRPNAAKELKTEGPANPAAPPVDLRQFQQGDIVDSARLLVQDPDGAEYWINTPHGVVLISQTCDIVVNEKEYVQVARLVPMDGSSAILAEKGAMPGRVAVSSEGESLFADLEHIATVHKKYIASFAPRHGAGPNAELKRFGARVGRKFSRFAFPDDVSYWLEPFKGSVLDKVGKPNSDLGHVLDKMVESLRLECRPSWDKPAPWDLKLVVVVKPEHLPMLDENDPVERSNTFMKWAYKPNGTLRTATEIATKLRGLTSQTPASERAWWWDAFAEALAANFRLKANAPQSARDAVLGERFSSEAITAEEFTYDRVLCSEEIDLDHLSGPLPR